MTETLEQPLGVQRFPSGIAGLGGTPGPLQPDARTANDHQQDSSVPNRVCATFDF